MGGIAGHEIAATHDRSALAAMVMTLLDHWRLTTEDQAALLGLAPGSRAALANYRRGKPIGTSPHQSERGSQLLAIPKHLRPLVPPPPATSSAYSTQALRERLRQDCYTFLPMPYTHSAAHNLGGETDDTLLHFLHGHKRGITNAAKTWIFIDEIPQAPLKLPPQLLNFMWLGVRFVVGGDFNQQLPIGEVWGEDAVLRLERSAAQRHMCNGLRLEFTECRRSDSAHFCVYASIPRQVTDLSTTVVFLIDQCPLNHAEI